MRISVEILEGFSNGNLGELPGRITDEIHEGISGGIFREIPAGLL